MAKCHSLAGGGGHTAGFRLLPTFSAAALRRKLLDAVMCGGSRKWRKRDEFASRSPVKLPDLKKNSGSDRLSELLKADMSDSGSDEADEDVKRKIEAFEELQSVVKGLQSQCRDRRVEAVSDVRRLAKDDAEARETLAILGAIPALIGMIDSDDFGSQISSLYALLNLGIGNEMNKAAMVKAGAVHKMLNLIESPATSSSVSEAIVANFLGLSALDSNKPIVGSSGAIPFLIKTIQNPPSSQSKQDSLRALFNLSLSPPNLPFLIESDLIPLLLSSIGDMEVSDRSLSVLSNLVAFAEGRKAVSGSPDAFPILIDILNWVDSPSCQEKAAYILMVMAHKSAVDRAAMVAAGIASALLEVALVGSALAQKRASRILEILRVEKGKGVTEGFGGCSGGAPAVSAPLMGEDAGMSEERRAVRELVVESLQCNLKRIVRRAEVGKDLGPSDQMKRVPVTATSKSLPF